MLLSSLQSLFSSEKLNFSSSLAPRFRHPHLLCQLQPIGLSSSRRPLQFDAGVYAVVALQRDKRAKGPAAEGQIGK